MASLKPQLLKIQDNEPSYTERPQFIVLCGPTGVGKSMVPQQIFKLEERDYTKIEIDSLVVQNQLYTNTIFTINKLDKNLIVNTIKGKDIKKRKLLTDLFNESEKNLFKLFLHKIIISPLLFLISTINPPFNNFNDLIFLILNHLI
jgi:ABC-type polar amino acid transport system ATPase subunit